MWGLVATIVFGVLYTAFFVFCVAVGVYVIFKRIVDKNNETFEKRDN